MLSHRVQETLLTTSEDTHCLLLKKVGPGDI